eukprot:GEMP01013104.1.p1 GENE.GEMP01013104.1~~GEMP01013104.1.p1  ORF type:complete len:632 (+),score=130.61 GEMP01013104.1:78-1973(+)
MAKRGRPPSLEGAPIDLLRLQKKQRSLLLDLLDEFGGKKDLVIDPSLAPLLDLFIEVDVLREHGVKIERVTLEPMNSEIQQAIFLIHVGNLHLLSYVAAQILHDERLERERTFVVTFVPRITEEAIVRLKKENCYANVQIRDFPLHIVACDKDVLSMQQPGAYRDIHVDGNLSPCFYTALCLMDLQNLYGVIPRVHAIGSASRQTCEVMKRLRLEDETEPIGDKLDDVIVPLSQRGIPRLVPRPTYKTHAVPCPIDRLVLIDRRVDLYSVLCSPFTYEALLDQHFDINCTTLSIGNDVIPVQGGRDKTVFKVNDDDPLYLEIRDMHIGVLGPLLHQKANAIQETYQEKDKLKSIQDIQDYMTKFKVVQAEHTSLTTHVNLASHVALLTQSEQMAKNLACEDEITALNKSSWQHIEDLIDQAAPIHEVLRLLCLFCIINHGMPIKTYDLIKRGIFQTYGYEQIITLHNLEKGGFLPQQRASVWSQIRRQFTLLVDDREADQDISYAYSGYAPLSIRLVQLLKSQPRGWRSIQDHLNLLWGPVLEIEQARAQEKKGPEVVLVFFIGGVTRAEIAALRKLEKLEDGKRRFIVATTEFWTSTKALSQMSHDLHTEISEKEKTKEPAKTEKKGWYR